MRAAIRLSAWIIAAMLLWPVAPVKAQQDAATGRPEITALDKDAAHLRELADAAARRAADWDALAKAARDSAAKATDPVVKKSWQDGADAHAARAQEQKNEAARLTAQADEKAAQARKLEAGSAPPPAPGAPPAPIPPVAGGAPPKPSDTNPAGETAAARTGGAEAPKPQPAVAEAACTSDKASNNELVPIEAVIGQWVSDVDGGTIEISPKTPDDKTRFVLKGANDWDGTYSDGKLTFTHTPIAGHMSLRAPDWARKKVEGQLTWSLELQLPHKCDEFVLKGPWYPGEIRFKEEKAPDGRIVKQEATLAGKGKPVDERYSRPLPPVKLQLFAVGVWNLKKITELYWGVPTVVEAVYEEPQDKETTIIEIITGDAPLKLKAHRDAEDFRRFLTDAFLPGVDKRTLRWEEPPATDRGSDDDANNPLGK